MPVTRSSGLNFVHPVNVTDGPCARDVRNLEQQDWNFLYDRRMGWARQSDSETDAEHDPIAPELSPVQFQAEGRPEPSSDTRDVAREAAAEALVALSEESGSDSDMLQSAESCLTGLQRRDFLTQYQRDLVPVARATRAETNRLYDRHGMSCRGAGLCHSKVHKSYRRLTGQSHALNLMEVGITMAYTGEALLAFHNGEGTPEERASFPRRFDQAAQALLSTRTQTCLKRAFAEGLKEV